MKYPNKDFHGLTVEEAVGEFHSFISPYLLSERETWCSIVTGQGPLQKALLEEIDSLDLTYNIKSVNLGEIKILV